MTRRKRKSNNPDGRPSQGLSEQRVEFRAPAELVSEVEASAKAEGVPLSEWWRRAARARLQGQHEG